VAQVFPQFKINSKVSPSGGREHPSRDGAGREVTMGMTISRRQKARRTRKMSSRGGLLLCSLLLNACPALSSTAPAGVTVPLAWNQSPDTNVTGYNVYYGTASHTYTNHIHLGNVTNTTISGLATGVAYFFAATCYDAAGGESGYSDEVSNMVLPPAIPALQGRASAGQFILTVNGSAGQTNQILASPDLKTWTVIGTVTMGTGGSLNFTDVNAAAFSQRFYRTQKIP
jgi:hypothetical protein